MSTTLTAEQLRRMEENRLKALQKKEEKNTQNQNQNQKSITNYITSSTTSSKPQASTNSFAPKSHSFGSTTSTNTTPIPSNTKQPSDPTMLVGKCMPFAEDPENRFEVHIGYHQGVIEIFKTIPSRKYDPENKRWSFSKKHLMDIIIKVNEKFNGKIRIDSLEETDKSTGKPKTTAKCALLDTKRFEVSCTYNPALQDIFKSMSSKSYNPESKMWSFDLKDHDELIKRVSDKLSASVNMIPLPKMVKSAFKDQLAGLNTSKPSNSITTEDLMLKIEDTISSSLMPFQIDGIKFAIDLNGRLLLADDMGLGKTIQALAIANYYKEDWPMFIVAPSSVKFMWKESIKRWMPKTLQKFAEETNCEVDELVQVLQNARQGVNPRAKVLVCSYDLMCKVQHELECYEFKLIIADECHFLKNIKASRTKAATKIFEKSNRVIMLSGTPALSRPAELFSQLHIIDPVTFCQFQDFGMRYCDGKETHFGMDYSGASNMKELRLILEQKVMIRREKKEVMSQLPSKTREMVVLDPESIQLNKKSLEIASKNLKNEKLTGMEKRGALLNYFAETCKVKSKAVCDYVLDLLESGKKFLVFAHHQAMLDAVQAECESAKYEFIRIDGATSSEKRQASVERFQNDEKCLVAILSITAANSGLTLTEANLVVFAELFWNPGILVQAEDRVYRIGQKNSVLIQYLCAKGTADDEIWSLVNDKLSVLSKAGLTNENLKDANTTESATKGVSGDEFDEDGLIDEMIKKSQDICIGEAQGKKQASVKKATKKAGDDPVPPSKKPKSL